MSTEINKQIALEIAHVLFIDIVGYSKLSVNEQHAAVEELNQIVRGSEQFQRAEAASRLLKIPTGDGMALVFYASPEAPAQCAVEISRALKEHPRLQLRMRIHSGPVSGVVDVNERANLTGAGINMAQRLMDCGDCGDAGHILLFKHVAEDEQTGDRHDNERAHRSKKCSALPERKTQRGAANQAKEKHPRHTLSRIAGTRRPPNTPEISGIFPLSTVANRLARPIRIPPIKACQSA
jgi:class 3 adenylate cyclase